MIGKRLSQIRQELKITQNETAKKFGVSYRAYTSYERGERKPSLDLLKTLYKNFNVNLNWLISGEGQMFNTSNETSLDIELKVNEILKQKGLID